MDEEKEEARAKQVAECLDSVQNVLKDYAIVLVAVPFCPDSCPTKSGGKHDHEQGCLTLHNLDREALVHVLEMALNNAEGNYPDDKHFEIPHRHEH